MIKKILSLGGHYFSTLKLEGTALVAVLLLGIVIVWQYHSYQDALQAQKTQIAESAIDSAVAIAQAREASREIDQTIVFDWQQARAAYRQAQQEVIDTTFLEYFELPSPTEEETVHVKPPAVTTPPTPTPDPPPAGVTRTRLDVLARGMWQSYCTANDDTTTADCTP